MLVYSETKTQFVKDVRESRIEEKIQNEVLRKLNRNSPRNEILSWKNSLEYMFKVLLDPEIPDSAGVAIEYNVPLTNRRIDFVLTGKDANGTDTAIIVELKQWSDVKKTAKDGVVSTFLNGRERETNHPSYQAWSYAALVTDFNETVRQENIVLKPCAYLHNLSSGLAINDPFYKHHLDKAPVFLSGDIKKLSDFLKRYVKSGDSSNIMYRIEHGVIKPSKSLADSLASMLKGNPEFILLDEQKVVFETALNLAHKAKVKPNQNKQVLIVRGGPGTGKSVVAINLLVELTRREMLVQYVTKNAAPREVFKSMLVGTQRKTHIDNMFKGSGSYIGIPSDYFDVLVIDEAHRLNEKSGMYGNLGDDQVKELIGAAQTSIFFIDEDQRVTLKDIGTVEHISNIAASHGATVTLMDLESQFRCNGSNGYLAWLDHALDIRDTANPTLENVDYDFRVFANLSEMKDEIVAKNRINNKARLVAGYCWDWISKKSPDAFDIVIPEHNFKARWNLTSDGSLWLISTSSVNEVGCIHTCQGLEVDYIGVIIGDDFVVRDGVVQTNADYRSSGDRSIRGYKKMRTTNREEALRLTDLIIKNTYRTLMTRGMKGCYIFCTDEETRKYFQKFAAEMLAPQPAPISEPYDGLHFPIVYGTQVQPDVGYVKVFDIAAAAGGFSAPQEAGDFAWVKLPDEFATKAGMFVIRVVGESMNKRIPNGSWCLFRENPGGTRNGKIVLMEHRDISDPDHGGSFTVKRYRSEKAADEEQLNIRIILSPESTAYGYSDIVIAADSPADSWVIGEFVAVL